MLPGPVDLMCPAILQTRLRATTGLLLLLLMLLLLLLLLQVLVAAAIVAGLQGRCGCVIRAIESGSKRR